MIRRIGIDFGTSTTVLQVKNYEDDGITPVGDRIDTKDVKFGKQSYCDTYVKQKQNRWYCGLEATKNIPDSITYANFKMQIESPDDAIAEGAREATLHFFQYLYKTYAEQRDNGQFGEKAEREETLVSYPVKWRQETAEFLLQTAAQAGFSNIRHMNEARAAISAVMTQSAQKWFQSDEMEQNILLCDMGAGTCDLVLCRYKASGAHELRILSCWPHGESTLTFGGREIDRRLQEYIVGIMEKNDLPVKRLKNSLMEFKVWKELEVSPLLAEGYEVESCDIIENAANGDCIDYSPMSRALLEGLIQGEMQDFIRLVNGAMQNCDEPFEKADLVILVGGNSQWYFIGDLLSGKRVGDYTVHMPISRDQIICPPNPQMTVAMGLVLSDLPMHVTNEKAIEKAAAPDRPEEPIKPNMTANNPKEKEPCLNDMVLSLEGIDVLRDFLIKMGNDKRYASSKTQFLKGTQNALPNDCLSVCNRVRKGMRLFEDVDIYFAHDSTLFESGKEGLFICNRGIGGRTCFDKTRLIPWRDFVTNKCEAIGDCLKYEDTYIAQIYIPEITGVAHDELVDILKLQEILKPYMIPGKESADENRKTQIRSIVREEFRTLQWGHYSDCYSIDQNETTIDLKNKRRITEFMEKFNIDRKKEIYAWCDLSGRILGQRDGFLATDSGIYYKEQLTKLCYFSWDRLSTDKSVLRRDGQSINIWGENVFNSYKNLAAADTEEKREALARVLFQVILRIQTRIRKLG